MRGLYFDPPRHGGTYAVNTILRHPREGGDPLALMPQFLPQTSRRMDSRLRGNDEGDLAIAGLTTAWIWETIA
jgi:hypothetical protein